MGLEVLGAGAIGVGVVGACVVGAEVVGGGCGNRSRRPEYRCGHYG